jgi:hypothetical protein
MAGTRLKPEVPEIYKNFVSVDPSTGAPADYDSLAIAYRKLAFLCAKQAGIAVQDQDDAVQAVLFRFWKNDGLSKYDPDREWTTASGEQRKAKFHTMFRSFVGLSMLAERDRAYTSKNRAHLCGTTADLATLAESPATGDPATEVIEEDAAERWLKRASLALTDLGRDDLVPVLLLCAEKAKVGGTVTRADIVEATGVRLRAATQLLTQLQEALKSADLGPETLSDCSDY